MPVNTMPVSPDDFEAALHTFAADPETAKLSIMAWGAPGIGKTETVERFAVERARAQFPNMPHAELKKKFFRDIRLNSLEPLDLRGLPFLDRENRQSVFFQPSFLPSEPGPGVIFLDEITTADRRMQAPSYGLLNERRIGEYQVPEGWMIVAAGNGVEHGAIAYEMGTALADRLVHYTVETNPTAWLEYGQRSNRVNEVVLSYIKTKPNHLEMCQERVKSGDLIAPSPRGWVRVSKILGAHRARPMSNALLSTSVAGVLGQRVAADFMLHFNEMDSMVKVDQLMAAKTDAEIMKLLPKKVSALHCMTYAFVSLLDEKTLPQIFKILYNMRKIDDANVNAPELSVAGFEMVMGKGIAKGLAKQIMNDETYKAYYAERKKQGLV